MLEKPYTILKGAILDVSEYIHSGVDIEDVEDTIESQILKSKKVAFARLVPGALAYDIRTTITDDKALIELLDSIVNNLDLSLVETKENNFLNKN